MKIARIAPIIVTVICIMGIIFLGLLLIGERDENKRLRESMVNVPPSQVEPCLIMEMPAFQDMSMEGAIFKEGTCSKGSWAPICQICGDDLSSEGRKQLMRTLLKEGPKK